MATATASGTPPSRSTFYVGMASVFVLIAFVGFIPTYWAKMAGGTFGGNPIVHIHGMLFFAWTIYYFIQVRLVAVDRTIDHRTWGLLGVSLVTAMSIAIVLSAINAMKVGDLIGLGDQARHFAVVPLSSLAILVPIFILAIANTKRPETHKRLMILFMIPLMQAALARLFKTAFSPPGAVGSPPVIISVPPGILACALVIAAMVYDWRTRGRPHRVYVIGLVVLLAQVLISVPLGASPQWMAFAKGLEGLAR